MHWTGTRPWQEDKQKIHFCQKDTGIINVCLKQASFAAVMTCQNLYLFVHAFDYVMFNDVC